MKTRIFLGVFGALLLAFSLSCKEEEPEEQFTVPILGTHFNYTVDVNTVTFTTTLTGNVWFKNETSGIEYPVVGGSVEVFIPSAGTYSFTCNTLVDGVPAASAPFNVVIDMDDLSFLETTLWKALSGGIGATKTWRMDLNADGKCVYFDGPMYYSGYSDGDDRRTEWSYWAWDIMPDELPYTVNGVEQTSFFNWSPDYPGNTWIMAANDYGTISFTGDDGTVETDVFGQTASGTFTFDTTTMKLHLTGVVLPIDTGRLNEGQYTEDYLAELRIFSLTDSAMQIGIRRSFEGGEVSEWVNVYNFVCADYNYPVPEEFTYEETVNTSFTDADLVGTWKFADIPMGWIGWKKVGDQGTTIPAHLFELWSTRADVVATLTSWGVASVDSIFTAKDANDYIFNGDGTCTLAGTANTYTVTDGVITLGTALTDEFTMFWFGLSGTELKVIDFNKCGPETALQDFTPEGIWFGHQNEAKMEYSAVQLVKQ